MKRTVIIVAAVIVAVAALWLVFKNNSAPGQANIFQREETPITLYRESGFLTWKREGEADYTRVETDELVLPNNIYVKTADDGLGYVVLPDNSTISLDKNTEILINYTPTKVSIMQLLGSTYHRVEALVSGKTYEVRTPGTLAAVRGTKFAVMYDNKRKKTSVSVTEHKVEIVPITRMDEIATTTGTLVDTGSTAVLDDAPVASTTAPDVPLKPRAAMVVQKTDRMTEEKKWIEENKPLDTELDSRKEKRKEYMEEFIKKMKEEKQKSDETKEESKPTTTEPKPAEVSKERVIRIKNVIKKIETERPDLKEEKKEEQKENETETKTPTTETKTGVTSGTQATSVTTPAPTPTTGTTLKNFDLTSETLSLEEEKFTNDFYAEYEKYLFIDAAGNVCRNDASLSAEDIVARLEKFSNSAGYFLPKKDMLLALAQAIKSACDSGAISAMQQALQGQFDTAYPFSQ